MRVRQRSCSVCGGWVRCRGLGMGSPLLVSWANSPALVMQVEIEPSPGLAPGYVLRRRKVSCRTVVAVQPF